MHALNSLEIYNRNLNLSTKSKTRRQHHGGACVHDNFRVISAVELRAAAAQFDARLLFPQSAHVGLVPNTHTSCFHATAAADDATL
jgi:hypothetical protein